MQTDTYFPVIPLADVPIYGSLESPEEHCMAILVVDDETIIANTLSEILNQSGYAAVPAYNAKMALEMAAGVAPDLLISDVVMPGMSGIDLAIQMRSTCPGCKVILFSGQATTVDLLASARAAGHTFQTLSKPVHPAVILARVAELLTVPMTASAGLTA